MLAPVFDGHCAFVHFHDAFRRGKADARAAKCAAIGIDLRAAADFDRAAFAVTGCGCVFIQAAADTHAAVYIVNIINNFTLH